MSDREEPHISSTLQWKDVRLPGSVSVSDLDDLILSVMKPSWRKTAMIIAMASSQCEARALPIDDEVIGARIAALADAKRIDSQGNLAMWRHSEVRLLAPMADEERLRSLEAQARAAYARMYEALNATEAAASYSDAKEALRNAIGLARRLGQADAAEDLKMLLGYIKSVYRSQSF
jgi:Protein of unknown function